MKANDFVAWMLRSPLYRMMGNTMLITVSGRKTGRPITTPVNYGKSKNTLLVLSSRNRTWWRNIASNPRVMLHMHGKELQGKAELILDEAAVAAQVGEYVRELPASAKMLGVRITEGELDPVDVERLARERLFVKVHLDTPLP